MEKCGKPKQRRKKAEKGPISPHCLALWALYAPDQQQELCGAQIKKKVSKSSNRRFELQDGTLYPVLHNLEMRGLVVSRTESRFRTAGGRPKILYQLTEAGITQLKSWMSILKALYTD